jgi:formylglycine-generating enzyme required for sulfatase activity
MRATMPRILGAFSICTEMSGSGPADWYGTYSSGAQTDPTGAASGSTRVFRGGSWARSGPYLRSAYRAATTPSYRNGSSGFRVGFKQQ